MIAPEIIPESPTANCCNADLILIKLPLLLTPAAAEIIVFGEIILPLAKTKNIVVKDIATQRGTTVKLVINTVGTKEHNITTENTRITPYLSVSRPMIGAEKMVATPPQKNCNAIFS